MNEPRCKTCGEMKLSHTAHFLYCAGWKTQYEADGPEPVRREHVKVMNVPTVDEIATLPEQEIPRSIWDAVQESQRHALMGEFE